MTKPEFLKEVNYVYLIGIKGVAMTALACCLRDMEIEVEGSDVEEIFVTEEVLRKRVIKWFIGFERKDFGRKPDLVVCTAAHGGISNPEAVLARRLGIPVLTHAQALGDLMVGKDGISVCGAGGKSTTSGILATVFYFADKRPSYAVGVGEIFPIGYPGKYDTGDVFIAEADEYGNSPPVDNRPRFVFQKPKVIICTNIEYDHPDIYKNIAETKVVFSNFFKTAPENGLLIINGDSSNCVEAAKSSGVKYESYGYSPSCDWRTENVRQNGGKSTFDLVHQKINIQDITIKIPGRFNIMNAVAALAASSFFGIDFELAKKGLEKYEGVKRRFEFIGEKFGIKLYDDYAHHPNEIRETLLAARSFFPGKRIIVVFQPHTYSRTKALFEEFSQAFNLANEVIITDIYSSAREKDTLGMSGKGLAASVSRFNPHVVFCAGEREVVKSLKEKARDGDVIITMGAGSIFQWHEAILKAV